MLPHNNQNIKREKEAPLLTRDFRSIVTFMSAQDIYKIGGKYHKETTTGEQKEVIDDNVGDVMFVGGWQPGLSIRCYKNLNLFFGPTIATDCLGLHFGIGF